jgi:hypothetical protein
MSGDLPHLERLGSPPDIPRNPDDSPESPMPGI